MSEIKLNECVGCQKQPDIFEKYGSGVKIGCSECDRFVSESLHYEAACEAWNLINMDYVDLINYAAKELDKERLEWLDRYRMAAGFKIR